MREVIEVEIGYKDFRYDIRNDMGPLRDACTWASHNLALRHHIILEGPYGKGEKVYVRLSGQMDDDFNIGNHLRGISSYLMKKYPYIKAFNYKPGVGLLYFKDIEERCHEEAIIESAPHAIQRIKDEILEAHKMRLDLVRYGENK